MAGSPAAHSPRVAEAGKKRYETDPLEEGEHMLSTKVIEGTNIINMQYSGELTARAVDQARDLMKQMLSEQSHVSLMLEYGEVDLERIEFAAMGEDLKSIGILEKMDGIAVVADQEWLQKTAEFIGSHSPADVRAFNTGHRDEALLWVTS